MNKYSGSNFDDFLKEEGIFEEVSARTQERLAALQAEDMPGPINRFFQWLQQAIHDFFYNPLALGAVGVGVVLLVIGGFYVGNHDPIAPVLVENSGNETNVSPFGFGVFPKIPSDFPDQNIWDAIKEKAAHDPKGAKNLELLARVRIELWNQGHHTKGVIMAPSSGLVYADADMEILPSDIIPMSAGREPRHSQYDAYFDKGSVPSGQIKFIGGGIDPYKFLNLPK